MKDFDLGQHLDLISRESRERLSISEHDQFVNQLRSGPLVLFQAEILRAINGKLNQLAIMDLGKPDALAKASFLQGHIMGLRSVFELAKDLLENAEEGEVH